MILLSLKKPIITGALVNPSRINNPIAINVKIESITVSLKPRLF